MACRAPRLPGVPDRVVHSLPIRAALAAPAVADDMHEVPVTTMQGPRAPASGVTICLNRAGGTLAPGWDDSAGNVSSVAFNVGGEVTIPAWRGGDRRWREVVSCVRDRYGEFAVDVVTERPRGGDYVMVMVGGKPALLGYPRSVSGVAPYTGEVMPDRKRARLNASHLVISY